MAIGDKLLAVKDTSNYRNVNNTDTAIVAGEKYFEQFTEVGNAGGFKVLAPTVVAVAADGGSLSPELGVLFTSSTALEASKIIKNSWGILYEVAGYSTISGFVQVYNTPTIPADGAVPIISFLVEADKNFFRQFLAPITFTDSICVAFSTTQPTKTLGTASAWFEVTYK